MTSSSSTTILLQHATAEHDAALRELSQLDSARTVTRPAIMAVVDDRLLAAASLHDGRIVADPFADAEQAVALLRLRVAAINGEGRRRRGLRGHRGRGLSLRPRPAV